MRLLPVENDSRKVVRSLISKEIFPDCVDFGYQNPTNLMVMLNFVRCNKILSGNRLSKR
jgi:hypothetical protein